MFIIIDDSGLTGPPPRYCSLAGRHDSQLGGLLWTGGSQHPWDTAGADERPPAVPERSKSHPGPASGGGGGTKWPVDGRAAGAPWGPLPAPQDVREEAAALRAQHGAAMSAQDHAALVQGPPWPPGSGGRGGGVACCLLEGPCHADLLL